MTTTHEGPASPSITWGYRRKSSLQQSHERQTKALHDLGIPEKRVFEDAMSGKTMNRPGWQNLLFHVRANDELWADGLDRLGRSTLATLQAMEELEQRGVRVRSAKPGEDLQGATGELIRQIMLVMAQWERRQMLELLRLGLGGLRVFVAITARVRYLDGVAPVLGGGINPFRLREYGVTDLRGSGSATVSPEATYGFTQQDGPSVEDVQLAAVTASSWRVCDGRLPEGDPLRLLAFVEVRGGVVEVMQLGSGFRWHEFESLEEALAFVIETGPQVARERLRGELAWLR